MMQDKPEPLGDRRRSRQLDEQLCREHGSDEGEVPIERLRNGEGAGHAEGYAKRGAP